MISSIDGNNTTSEWASISQQSTSSTVIYQGELEQQSDASESANDKLCEDPIPWSSSPHQSYLDYTMDPKNKANDFRSVVGSQDDETDISALIMASTITSNFNRTVTNVPDGSATNNDGLILGDGRIEYQPPKAPPSAAIFVSSYDPPIQPSMGAKDVPSVIYVSPEDRPPTLFRLFGFGSGDTTSIGQQSFLHFPNSNRRLLVAFFVLLFFTVVLSITFIVLSVGKDSNSSVNSSATGDNSLISTPPSGNSPSPTAFPTAPSPGEMSPGPDNATTSRPTRAPHIVSSTPSPITNQTSAPVQQMTDGPTSQPSNIPSTIAPTPVVSSDPTIPSTLDPTIAPTDAPSLGSTSSPTGEPTPFPSTSDPTQSPSSTPGTPSPTLTSTSPPTPDPTHHPTPKPTLAPVIPETRGPTEYPTSQPSQSSTGSPTPSALAPVPTTGGVVASIQVDKATYIQGENIVITFKNDPPTSSDWIAMQKLDSTSSSTSTWTAVLWVLACGTQTCTQPTSSGTVVFGPSDPYEGDFAALTPGNYVMHLLRGTGSYPSYAASDPFIIVAGAPVTAPVAAPAVAPI